jgi:hypothetical protein
VVHAAEVLERLVRDVKIVIKNFSLAPTDNLHSILGDDADWKSEPGSLSEVTHFSELIAERRAALRFSELGSLDGCASPIPVPCEINGIFGQSSWGRQV